MTEDEATAPADPTAGACEQLRSTAKWLITSFAAVGAALLAGLQLADLHHAEHPELAGLGFALGILGVIAAIGAASTVLQTRALSPGIVASSKPLCDAVAADPTMLEGRAASLGALATAYQAAITATEDAWKDPNAAVDGASERETAVLAQEHRDDLADLLERLCDAGLYLEISRTFGRARIGILIATVLSAAGVGLFAFSTGKADRKVSSPQQVRLSLLPDAAQALRSELGRRCVKRPVRAVLLGRVAGEPEVLTLPGAGCAVRRLRVSVSVGILTPPAR